MRTAAPTTSLALANTRKPVRQSRERAPRVDDPLATARTARPFLRALGVDPGAVTALTESDLDEVRRVRDAVERVMAAAATASADGKAPELDEEALAQLNAFTRSGTTTVEITSNLATRFTFAAPSAAVHLAIACACELGACDPTRIRACARVECGRFFYDATRNRSSRWHADDPCGWRARAERRAVAAVS